MKRHFFPIGTGRYRLAVRFAAVLLFIFTSAIFGAEKRPPAAASVLSDPSAYMSGVDKEHSTQEFRTLLKTIRSYFIEEQTQELGFFIFLAWSELTKEAPQIKLYDFVAGLENYIVYAGHDLSFDKLLGYYSRSYVAGRKNKNILPNSKKRR